jgi:hypothetical protein
MTHLRAIVLGGAAAALIVGGAATKSVAIENGDFTNYLRGATQGLPLGGLPPPGLYGGFGLDVTGLPAGLFNAGAGNQKIGAAPGFTVPTTAPAFGYGVNLLWVPGWTFLGANYGAGIVQGFYFATSEGGSAPPFTSQTAISPELANTSFTPIDLSWNLGHGWFVSAALSIVGPDGSQWGSTGNNVDLNPDFWTVAPGWAISYFDANWQLSANFLYDINTASRGVTMATPYIPPGAGNGYISGNELFGDFSALYKIGKWQIGPVGYFEAQTTADSPGGGYTCATAAAAATASGFMNSPVCAYQSQIAIGALVGYDFGPAAVQLWFDDTVECRNAVCGLDVWARMTFRIWAPEAAKPLVAKN